MATDQEVTLTHERSKARRKMLSLLCKGDTGVCAMEIVERNARAHESLEEWREAAALRQTLMDILQAKINRSLGEE